MESIQYLQLNNPGLSFSWRSEMVPLTGGMGGQTIPNLSYHGKKITSLGEILQELGTLPAYTLYIGQCWDGLPILADLTNPRVGSILIVGNRQSLKTHLMHSMLISAATINRLANIKIIIARPGSGEMQGILELPGIFQVDSLDGREAGGLLEVMHEMFDARQERAALNSAIILAIEELSFFVGGLMPEELLRFSRLIRKGPEVGIVTFATLDTNQTKNLEPELLDNFKTNLFSYPAPVGLGEPQFEPANGAIERISEKSVFSVKVVPEWLNFGIPPIL